MHLLYPCVNEASDARDSVLPSKARPIRLPLQQALLAVVQVEVVAVRIIFLKYAGRSRIPVVPDSVAWEEASDCAVGYPHGGVCIRILRLAFLKLHPVQGLLVFLLEAVPLVPDIPMTVPVVERGRGSLRHKPAEGIVQDLVQGLYLLDPRLRGYYAPVPEILCHGPEVSAEPVPYLGLVFSEIICVQIGEILLQGARKQVLALE